MRALKRFDHAPFLCGDREEAGRVVPRRGGQGGYRRVARRLGWLGVTNDQLANIERLTYLAHVVRSAGYSDALLLGMGGSSLGPEVLRMTFGKVPGFPELHVLVTLHACTTAQRRAESHAAVHKSRDGVHSALRSP